MRHRPLAALTIALALASSAAAQESVTPRPLFRGTVARDAPWLALLREAHARGAQAALLSVATEFLADLSRAPEVSALAARAPCCDPRQHVIQVAFAASEAAEAPLVRVFVHKSALTRAALPGIRGPGEPLFEVFVAEDLSITLRSIYHSTPLAHPLAEDAEGFVKLVLGKLALPVGASTIAGRAAAVMEAATRTPLHEELRRSKAPLAVTISRIDLPHNRAKLTIEHSLVIADPARHIRAQVQWIADTALRHAVVAAALDETPADSPDEPPVDAGPDTVAACRAMTAAIAAGAGGALDAPPCSPLGAEPAGCFKAVAAAMSEAYEDAAGQGGGCPPDGAFPLVRRFLSAVPTRLAKATGTAVVRNAPKSHWNFGLSTAFIASIETDNAAPRTKISSGRIVADPFDRVLAMGIVNFIPAGYDPESVQLSARERVRLFGGVAFAPHFGAAGGAAWALNRHVGINAGYALLVYDTPKPGESIDAAPSPANRAAPFDLASTHALFIGLTYSFR